MGSKNGGLVMSELDSPKFAEYYFNNGGDTDCLVKAQGIGNGDVALIFLPQLGYAPLNMIAADARILIASIEAALVVTRQLDKLKESA